jgi:hypothetical protein
VCLRCVSSCKKQNMVNLLSPQTKEQMVAQYKKNMRSTACLFVAGACLFGSALMYPVILRYQDANELYEKEIKRIDEYLADTQIASRKEEAVVVAKRLRESKRVLSSRLYSEVVKEVVAIKPEGMSILSIVSKKENTIQLDGETPDRATLVALADGLRSLSDVAVVDVPIANFVEGRNAPFSITFYLNKYEK